MKKILSIICTIICFAFTACYSTQSTSPEQFAAGKKYIVTGSVTPIRNNPKSENTSSRLNYKDMKAVWLSYIDLSPMLTGKTETEFKNGFETACKNISEIHCNTVFVHVRPFGDAFYNSDIYPCSRFITGSPTDKPPFDPLSIMVETAHKYKLSIHAWINPLRLDDEEYFDGYDAKYLIKKWYDSKNGYVNSVQGDKRLWLDPGYSEVRKLIADGAQEIAKKYDIDGIHYDDYFYPTTADTFDKECFAKSGSDKSLSVWRCENISLMCAQIYKAVKSVDKSIIVGAAPQGNVDNNYRYMYADVKKWGSETGYVDYICPQIYFGYNNPVKPFLETLKEWENIVVNDKVDLYVGLAVYKVCGGDDEFVNTKGIISKQIKDIGNSKACKGFALYNYINLFSDSVRSREELDSIKTQLSH